jgi:hypothetical protein
MSLYAIIHIGYRIGISKFVEIGQGSLNTLNDLSNFPLSLTELIWKEGRNDKKNISWYGPFELIISNLVYFFGYRFFSQI